MEEEEETIKFIQIDKVNATIEINPEDWKMYVNMKMSFLMSENTAKFIQKRAIILHVNHLDIQSITLQNALEEMSEIYECKFTQTPGILHNDYISDKTPTYETFEQNYSGSIGQLTIQWPEGCELNPKGTYILHFKYSTSHGSGLYSTANTLFTLDGFYDTASWMPCVCNSLQMVCYEMKFIVPEPFVVIASGTPSIPLIENNIRTFHYTLTTRILPKSYGFVVANVKLLSIESSLPVGFFASKNEEERAEYSFMDIVPKAFRCFKKYTTIPNPFDTSIVVINELPYSYCMSFAGLILVSSEMLYLDDNADRYRKFSFEIGQAIASQWIGHYIIPSKTSDEWIIVGLRDFISQQFTKSIHGQNYVKYKLLKSQELVFEKKWGDPLHNEESPLRKIFVELEFDDHFQRKCAIAMGVMENSLGKEKMSKMIQKIILKINENNSHDIHRAIKTKIFIKGLQEVNSSLMKQFEERLVNGTGYSKINISFTFQYRTSQTEFVIIQSKKEKGYNVVPIRIHELEQVVEDTIELTGERTEKSIACHSRLKRTRKKTIRTDIGETIDYDLETRDKKQGIYDTEIPILYIEVDPDNDYPRKIKRDKKSFTEVMLLTQLEIVRTVRGQLVTIEGLSKCGSEKSIESLFDFLVNNHKCFYKVQIAAAIAMARMSHEENDYIGFKLLRDFYVANYYEDSIGVVPLDFSNPLKYELQKGLIKAFADVRVHTMKTRIRWDEPKEMKRKDIDQLDPLNVQNDGYKKDKKSKQLAENVMSYRPAVELLLEIAENSTNERNQYQYGVFLKIVIMALSKIKTDVPEYNERISKFIIRELNKDKIIPSDRNIVTLSVLHYAPQYCDLKALSSPGNYYEVRIMAIRALLLTSPQEGMMAFVECHKQKEKGRIRYGLCEMALSLRNYPSIDVRRQPYFVTIGKEIFELLCDREDHIKLKIQLALVFKKWWGRDLVPKPAPPPMPINIPPPEPSNGIDFEIKLI